MPTFPSDHSGVLGGELDGPSVYLHFINIRAFAFALLAGITIRKVSRLLAIAVLHCISHETILTRLFLAK